METQGKKLLNNNKFINLSEKNVSTALWLDEMEDFNWIEVLVKQHTCRSVVGAT